MSARIEMTGQRYGHWTVIRFAGKLSNGQAGWLCRCDCGNQRTIPRSNLVNGLSTQCVDCSGRIGEFQDLTGKTFGRWTVLSFAEKKGTNILWLCRCSCGQEAVVAAGNLRSGGSTRCLRCARSGESNPNYKTGAHVGGDKAGKRNITYISWLGAMLRCTDPNCELWPRYGGNGILMCKRWRESYQAFLADMGPRQRGGYSLDRLNRDETTRHYSCGKCSECLEKGWIFHCRWATDAEQHRNKSNNRHLTFRGRTMCVVDWAHECGIKVSTLFARLNKGWSVKRALTTPTRNRY